MQHDFILLDRSGSMGTLWDEALGSVNAYVAQLAKDKVDTGVTLAVFDAERRGQMSFDVIRDRIIPSTWRRVSREDAEPRAWTPLSDAVGKIVNLAKAGNYDKVAIIIMTDGAENASAELTVAQARALLDECRAKNWQVIFLGANFDNIAQAQSYGTASAATLDSVRPQSLGATMRMSASKRGLYGATGQSMVFSDEEKTTLKEQGAPKA